MWNENVKIVFRVIAHIFVKMDQSIYVNQDRNQLRPCTTLRYSMNVVESFDNVYRINEGYVMYVTDGHDSKVRPP